MQHSVMVDLADWQPASLTPSPRSAFPAGAMVSDTGTACSSRCGFICIHEDAGIYLLFAGNHMLASVVFRLLMMVDISKRCLMCGLPLAILGTFLVKTFNSL